MYLEELNDKQLLAVKETEGYIRVIAGPGTGKTRVLTSRFIYLVQELAIDPDSILCMTFTRKAMNEMKDRIRKEIGNDTYLKYVLTYHSFGSLFLREEIRCLGYTRGFKIYDENNQWTLLKKLYDEKGIVLSDTLFQDTKDMIHEIKKTEIYIPRMYDRHYEDKILDQVNTMEEKIINSYLLNQRKNRWLDFDDLIFYTHYILSHYPDIKNAWQDRFSYVEVDEAQDTSAIENEIIEMLSDKCKNLFVVGDPDQNIYEWRDSDNRILLEFGDRHPECKTFTLEKNYRSTKIIISNSNRLIKHNQKRIEKKLIALKDEGSIVSYEHLSDCYEEAALIANRILATKENGFSYRDIAVIYRCNFLSKAMEDMLRIRNIPYYVVGSVSFYSLSEIQDLIALIKLFLFEDDESFKRIINRPTRKFGKKKIDYLETIRNENESLYHALLRNRNDIQFIESDISSFLDSFEKIKDMQREWGLEKVINHIYDDSEYHDYLMGLKNVSHLENAEVFLNDIKEYARNKEDASLLDYYQIYLENIDETRKDYDCVFLMTIHAAKGLEFRDVHVIGLDEGVCPHKKTIAERKDDGLEEERRLLYVAMTRAKDYLYLYSERKNGFSGECFPSRFLKEIFPELNLDSKSNEEKETEKKPRKKKTNKIRTEIKPLPKKRKEKKGTLTSLFDAFTK